MPFIQLQMGFGTAKIDPPMAAFNAIALMAMNLGRRNHEHNGSTIPPVACQCPFFKGRI